MNRYNATQRQMVDRLPKSTFGGVGRGKALLTIASCAHWKHLSLAACVCQHMMSFILPSIQNFVMNCYYMEYCAVCYYNH